MWRAPRGAGRRRARRGLPYGQGGLEEASKDPAFLEQAQEVSKVIADKGRDAFWQFQQDELKKYLPPAVRMGIRK